MNETLDIRPYAAALGSQWVFLLAGAVLAAVLVAGISFLLPPTYEASALVLVTNPSQLVQFDPRFEAASETRPLQVYPALATSDSLLQGLLGEIKSQGQVPDTVTDLRDAIRVSTENDPGLLRLTVQHRDAQTAARIANLWAALFVKQANAAVGDQDTVQLEFYTSQRHLARQDLDSAQGALRDFQATNRTPVVEAQLHSARETQAALLNEQTKFNFLLRDIRALRQLLAEQNGSLLPADETAVLLLYIRAFGDEQEAFPLELQIDGAASAPNGARVISSLESLQDILQEIIAGNARQLETLEPQVIALEEELHVLGAEKGRLLDEVTLAKDSYTALSRKVTEEGILAQDTSRGLRLASPAVSPEEPVAPREWLNGILAAVIALAALAGVTLYRQWQAQ